jgi:LacI family transcriptional regulator
MSRPDVSKRAGRATLADVALRAGVSRSIASRVLNRRDDLVVRPETTERVLRAQRELDYRPNAYARALTQRQSRVVSLLLPDLTNPANAYIARGAVERAQERGFVVLLGEDHDSRDPDKVISGLLRSGRVDGVIVGSFVKGHRLPAALGQEGFPHVFVNRAVRGSGRNVVLDSGLAREAMVEFLHRLGHRHIGHVAGPLTLSPARDRRRRFLAAAADYGLPEPAVVEGEFSEYGGAHAADRLLSDHPELTAVYASSIGQGIGILHTAWRRGLAVPAQLSITAYDDLPVAQFTVPPLTTVRVRLGALGAAAVDALLDQIEGSPPRDVTVPAFPEIMVRESTAPPAPAPGNRPGR